MILAQLVDVSSNRLLVTSFYSFSLVIPLFEYNCIAKFWLLGEGWFSYVDQWLVLLDVALLAVLVLMYMLFLLLLLLGLFSPVPGWWLNFERLWSLFVPTTIVLGPTLVLHWLAWLLSEFYVLRYLSFAFIHLFASFFPTFLQSCSSRRLL